MDFSIGPFPDHYSSFNEVGKKPSREWEGEWGGDRMAVS